MWHWRLSSSVLWIERMCICRVWSETDVYITSKNSLTFLHTLPIYVASGKKKKKKKKSYSILQQFTGQKCVTLSGAV